MNELIEGVDYVFTPSEDSGNNLVNVTIETGDFSGVVYEYGKVAVEEDEKNDQAYLSFEFNIIDNNGIEGLDENLAFKNYIGDILNSILTKSIEVVDHDWDGTDYIETSDVSRGVH